jgi:thiamine transport system permease protein
MSPAAARTALTRGSARLTPPAWVLGLLPAGFLALFFAYPVVRLLRRSFTADGFDVLTEPVTRQVVWFTVWQAVVSTGLTVVLGLPLAYVLHRVAVPGRRLLLAVATVPFVLPTVVVGAAFRVLLPASWIGDARAVILAHVFFNVAVVVRVVGGLWAHVDPRYEQAARTLGAGPWRVFRTVTWPLIRGSVAAASVLVFLFTFTSYGAVVVLGGPSSTTLEVEIYRRTAQLLDLPGAAALAVVQLVVLVAVLAVSARLQARLAVAQQVRASSAVPEPVRGWGVRLLVGVAGVECLVLAAPPVALVVRSLRVGDGWGLTWWRGLGEGGSGTTRDVPLWPALRTSLEYAAATTVVAVVVGGLAACAVAYARRGGGLLDLGLMLPLGTSAVTVGFGFLVAFGSAPLDLRSSWVIVPLAHALVAVPLVVRTVLPVLRSLDPRLRAAAATLGASPWRAWLTVDARVLSRALALGAGFAAAVSLGEFGATSFLARAGTPTLPVEIARLLTLPGDANAGGAAAAATLLMLLTGLVVLAADSGRTRAVGSW